MKRKPFEIGRPDGRSNAEVLLALVQTVQPGHIFTYEDLIAGLSWEGRTFTVQAVQGLVREAAHVLSKREARVLRNVRLVGYKVAHAKEHVSLALVRQDRAEVQVRRGLDMLRHVHWDEMNDNERKAHEGTLLVTEALYRNQMALQRRQAKVEDLIANLTRRVDDLSVVAEPDAKAS